MAKPLVVQFGAASSSFAIHLLERSDIYGARRRVMLDAQGRPCTRAALTPDGRQLLASGMTAQGYFTAAGHSVARAALVGLDAKGAVIEPKPSTLGVAQTLSGPLLPAALIDFELRSIYSLQPEQIDAALEQSLKSGQAFSCPFNYVTGLEVETAHILHNDEGYFALVGQPAEFDWVQEGQTYAAPALEEVSDDLDFEAL